MQESVDSSPSSQVVHTASQKVSLDGDGQQHYHPQQLSGAWPGLQTCLNNNKNDTVKSDKIEFKKFTVGKVKPKKIKTLVPKKVKQFVCMYCEKEFSVKLMQFPYGQNK